MVLKNTYDLLDNCLRYRKVVCVKMDSLMHWKSEGVRARMKIMEGLALSFVNRQCGSVRLLKSQAKVNSF